MVMPVRPAAMKSSSSDFFLRISFLGERISRQIYARKKRVKRISRALNEDKRYFVQINVMPQMKIVKQASKKPGSV